jgi:hypothetical protein
VSVAHNAKSGILARSASDRCWYQERRDAGLEKRRAERTRQPVIVRHKVGAM